MVDESTIQVDKISFGVIQIASIKISITFKLESKAFDFDFSNPRYLFGLMNFILPFLSNLASITDAKIKFNELILFEGFYSQEKLIENISKIYMN